MKKYVVFLRGRHHEIKREYRSFACALRAIEKYATHKTIYRVGPTGALDPVLSIPGNHQVSWKRG